MNIILFRNESRALIVLAGRDLIDCPSEVRHWLGPPVSDAVADLTENTPMLGIQASELILELRQHGFCALDLDGVVRFSHTAPTTAALAAELLRS